MLTRVYRIFMGGKPAIQITERFPDDGEGLVDERERRGGGQRVDGDPRRDGDPRGGGQ